MHAHIFAVRVHGHGCRVKSVLAGISCNWHGPGVHSSMHAHIFAVRVLRFPCVTHPPEHLNVEQVALDAGVLRDRVDKSNLAVVSCRVDALVVK